MMVFHYRFDIASTIWDGILESIY